jgi:hypothetical protein
MKGQVGAQYATRRLQDSGSRLNCDEASMTKPSNYSASSFLAFLPKEYQGEFSRDWIMGLSPFEDQTCIQCFTVHQGKWVSVEPRKIDEQALKCEVWNRRV